MDRREITIREDESRAEIDNLKAERTLLVGGAVAYMILLFALFASSFYLTMHNHPYAAASLLALVSGVTVFASIFKKNEKEKKAKELNDKPKD